MTELLYHWQVLGDEVKRKQYDTYGTADFGFGSGSAGSGQQYRHSGPTIDPEELFRKIFGEFSQSPFGDFSTVFDQPQEVKMNGSPGHWCVKFLGAFIPPVLTSA